MELKADYEKYLTKAKEVLKVETGYVWKSIQLINLINEVNLKKQDYYNEDYKQLNFVEQELQKILKNISGTKLPMA